MAQALTLHCPTNRHRPNAHIQPAIEAPSPPQVPDISSASQHARPSHPTQPKPKPMSADFWAGWLSGAASVVIGNPLDLLKVRLQAGQTASLASHNARTLLAGLPAPVLTYGALNAVLFASYNRSLALLAPASDGGTAAHPPPLWSHFLAGAVAGLATFVISTPTELIKCRAQVANDRAPPAAQPTSWSIARDILRAHGLRGLFAGGSVTATRDAVGYGFWFLTYEGSRAVWEAGVDADSLGRRSPPWYASDTVKVLVCGGLAGVATWTSVFPLDVIKTRVQTQANIVPLAAAKTAVSRPAVASTPLLRAASTDGAAVDPGARHRGALSTARHIYRNEGAGVFWRGLGVCNLRAFIVNAAQWTVYEWGMRMLA